MSFWDSLKPATRAPTATRVDLSADKATLTLGWEDGQITTVGARTLRQQCPCAECVEEWSGKRTYDVQTIAPGMKISEFSSVGNYALTFTFADQHRTGIFTWAILKKLSHP